MNDEPPAGPYPPISSYAVIGDNRTVALIGRDGAIEWLCLPDAGGSALLCRLLDRARGGHLSVLPDGQVTASRAYEPGTNVLVTTLEDGRGRTELVDFMAMDSGPMLLARRIRREGGETSLNVVFRPTLDYAGRSTRLRRVDGGIEVPGGGRPVRLWTTRGDVRVAGDEARVTLSLADGDTAWIFLSGGAEPPADPEATLRRARSAWSSLASAVQYEGPYRAAVERSALLLDLLVFEPTGAVFAAPTTSLPEVIGGERNWDYRYAWLRDSALVIDALMVVGHRREALRFWKWLCRVTESEGSSPYAVYTVRGAPVPAERALPHLEGYRSSRPVRTGNAARRQQQLDIYGEILGAAAIYHEHLKEEIQRPFATALRRLADNAARDFRNPDHGIWEFRAAPRHFVHSKVMAWHALASACKLHSAAGLPGDAAAWAGAAEELRADILSRGWSEERRSFIQAYGHPYLDAGALVLPLVGFLPPNDPRVRSTIEVITAELTDGEALLRRYDSPDGLPGREGAFLLASFWLVDCLAMAGRREEAARRFERLLGYANDVGLLSEEVDGATGELLGNFPQAFVHAALIRSAVRMQERPG